jgi:medium-chain acyl-[acyl-carrier-protein] hydrolase
LPNFVIETYGLPRFGRGLEARKKGDFEMKSTVNTFEYSVAPENIDFQGLATVPSMCGNIINAIGQNIRKEGCGVDVMKEAGYSWVLLRSAFEIDDRPRLYDLYNIKVWPVKGGGLTYNRCVTITDDEGKEIGRGVTEWCVIDIKTRRPISPELDLSDVDIPAPCRSPRRIVDFEPELCKDKEIGYSDCDFNGHLNNTHYIEMFYNMLPDEVLSSGLLTRIDINFRKEVHRGDIVSFGLRRKSEDEFLFVAKTQGSPLCHASLLTA